MQVSRAHAGTDVHLANLEHLRAATSRDRLTALVSRRSRNGCLLSCRKRRPAYAPKRSKRSPGPRAIASAREMTANRTSALATQDSSAVVRADDRVAAIAITLERLGETLLDAQRSECRSPTRARPPGRRASVRRLRGRRSD